MADAAQTRRWRIAASGGRLFVGTRSVALPHSRGGRIALGSGLVAGGMLGFLPVLGFWMLPLGLIVLSQDIGFVRRQRRRLVIRWEKWRRSPKA